MENLGPRLKAFRLASGKSLRNVATELDVSPSFLSQIENNKSTPSVSTLISLAKLLRAPLESLFEKAGENNVVSSIDDTELVTRNSLNQPADAWTVEGTRISVVNSNARSFIIMDDGIRWERLAVTLDPNVSFMEIIYPPGSSSNSHDGLSIHEGYEYGYALEGEIEVTIGETLISLTKGQSIGFDSTIPHKFRNIGKTNFRGIWFDHGHHTL
jgi:transcriptional regulator with XRE-family HTH domain/quercetin dioxygenase-like cupin family protein